MAKNFKELIGEGTSNPIDNVVLSVPLFIRLLEWAYEDAKSDVELHILTENILANGRPLSTEDYESLLPK